MRSLGVYRGNSLQWEPPLFIHRCDEKSKRCLIIVPFHKKIPNKQELASLYQVVNILGEKYEIAMAHGVSMDMSFYYSLGITFSEVLFSDKCFSSWWSYCSMLEMQEFYEVFSDYDFILIYQLDAWIFYDRLDYFLTLGYDYIGPPHYVFGRLSVGNGGFSLRKIKSFISLCAEHKDEAIIEDFMAEDTAFTERFSNILKIPSLDVASEFALDHEPLAQYLKTLKFPMGGHNVKTYNGHTPCKISINNRWNFWKNFVNFDEVLKKNNCHDDIIKLYAQKPKVITPSTSVFTVKKRIKRGNRAILRLR